MVGEAHALRKFGGVEPVVEQKIQGGAKFHGGKSRWLGGAACGEHAASDFAITPEKRAAVCHRCTHPPHGSAPGIIKQAKRVQRGGLQKAILDIFSLDGNNSQKGHKYAVLII
jgi:hypothetical protein